MNPLQLVSIHSSTEPSGSLAPERPSEVLHPPGEGACSPRLAKVTAVGLMRFGEAEHKSEADRVSPSLSMQQAMTTVSETAMAGNNSAGKVNEWKQLEKAYIDQAIGLDQKIDRQRAMIIEAIKAGDFIFLESLSIGTQEGKIPPFVNPINIRDDIFDDIDLSKFAPSKLLKVENCICFLLHFGAKISISAMRHFVQHSVTIASQIAGQEKAIVHLLNMGAIGILNGIDAKAPERLQKLLRNMQINQCINFEYPHPDSNIKGVDNCIIFLLEHQVVCRPLSLVKSCLRHECFKSAELLVNVHFEASVYAKTLKACLFSTQDFNQQIFLEQLMKEREGFSDKHLSIIVNALLFVSEVMSEKLGARFIQKQTVFIKQLMTQLALEKVGANYVIFDEIVRYQSSAGFDPTISAIKNCLIDAMLPAFYGPTGVGHLLLSNPDYNSDYADTTPLKNQLIAWVLSGGYINSRNPETGWTVMDLVVKRGLRSVARVISQQASMNKTLTNLIYSAFYAANTAGDFKKYLEEIYALLHSKEHSTYPCLHEGLEAILNIPFLHLKLGRPLALLIQALTKNDALGKWDQKRVKDNSTGCWIPDDVHGILPFWVCFRTGMKFDQTYLQALRKMVVKYLISRAENTGFLIANAPNSYPSECDQYIQFDNGSVRSGSMKPLETVFGVHFESSDDDLYQIHLFASKARQKKAVSRKGLNLLEGDE